MTFIDYKWMVITANFLMLIDNIPIIRYHRYFFLTFMSISVGNSSHRVEENSKMTFNNILYLILLDFKLYC